MKAFLVMAFLEAAALVALGLYAFSFLAVISLLKPVDI
jgi:hypothetical protein